MNGQSARKPLRYTWDDYRGWPDDERWEIIGGEAHAMTPAPTPRHQAIVVDLVGQLHKHFAGRPCKVFVSPIDVHLSDEDVVQPDVVVVCDPKQITRTHIEGPPTLVVEVQSPSTALLDRTRKMALYARTGIGEVWLVTPYPWLVEVYRLDAGSYRLAGAYSKDDRFASSTFSDLVLDLQSVFDFPIDPDERIEMVKEGHPRYAAKAG